MKKFTISLISLALVFTTLPTTHARNYTDLTSSHKYFEAIDFLSNQFVLEGYSDGTFRPDAPVNRAEFLKIVLEGSNITLNETKASNFIDIKEGEWFTSHVKKAEHMGWIQGFGDGTFRPTQTIIKSEALKIIAEVQNWATTLPETDPFTDVATTDWFAKYVAYAKDNNYLDDSPVFFPFKKLNRGLTADIIFRTWDPNAAKILRELPENDDDEDESSSNYSSNFTFNYATIEKNYYDSVTTALNIPNTFYNNEVYVLSGQISTSDDTATVLIQDTSTSETKKYSTTVTNKNFEIPLFFNEPGKYFIGIIPGESGQAKAAEIAVQPNLPGSSDNSPIPSAPPSPSIEFKDDKTSVKFDTSANTIKKFKFEQGSKSVTYYNRQNLSSIPVNYADFDNFAEGSTTLKLSAAALSTESPLEISSDFSSNSTKIFDAIEHTYSEINHDLIDFNPPDTYPTPKSFSIQGETKADTLQAAYVIRPDGFVTDLNLSTSASITDFHGQATIPSGNAFTFNYIAPSAGRYIIEINDTTGIAVVNHPIYIGNGIPLLPDYFDSTPRNFYEGSFSSTTLKQELLDLINESRLEHGIPPVSLSDELDDLAQDHSDDMADNNFFSHINQENKTPDQRRLDAGITTLVAENIAKDVSVKFCHEGLMRSAAHRGNILDDTWERVGIGISLDGGYLIVSEEFSTSVLSDDNLNDKKDPLISAINSIRTNADLSTLNYSSNLEKVAQELNSRSIAGTLDNAAFTEILQTYTVTGNTQVVGRIHFSWADIQSSILEDGHFMNASWVSMGMDMQLDGDGNINLFIILNHS